MDFLSSLDKIDVHLLSIVIDIDGLFPCYSDLFLFSYSENLLQTFWTQIRTDRAFVLILIKTIDILMKFLKDIVLKKLILNNVSR